MPTFEREPRPEKVDAVNEIKTMLGSGAVILTDFQGLDVKGISDLRKKLREAGSGYKVVKNTLFTLAAAGTPAEPLSEGLAGSTALVYTDEDPVAAAKTLQDFIKVTKSVIKVKSGMVDGRVFTAAQVESLAKIPPKQELYAMLVGGLQSPLTGLVGTLQQTLGQLVFTLQAVADKKAA